MKHRGEKALKARRLKFDAMVGVGGIGSGIFFQVEGNRTLGREESRMGRFLDRRDYCKLHIISHYVRALLGRRFRCVPVGKVGDDETGRRLLAEMRAAGLDTRLVKAVPGCQTMNCICIVYPDGGGGNLTVCDSASSKLSEADVEEALPQMRRHGRRGIALAVPEAPMGARRRLLELAGAHGMFRAASFTSAEIAPALRDGTIAMADLVSINRDEASALAGKAGRRGPADATVRRAVEILASVRRDMLVSITAGAEGSWAWDGKSLSHLPPHKVDVVSAAGAGDANFAGILAGLAAGLGFAHACELGALVAAMSVTSPHTIHKGIDRISLRDFSNGVGARPSPCVAELLL